MARCSRLPIDKALPSASLASHSRSWDKQSFGMRKPAAAFGFTACCESRGGDAAMEGERAAPESAVA